MSTLHQVAPRLSLGSFSNVETIQNQPDNDIFGDYIAEENGEFSAEKSLKNVANSVTALPRGLFYGAGVRGGQAATLLAGGVASVFDEDVSDAIFSQLQSQQDYWRKPTDQDTALVDQVLFGFGDIVGTTAGGWGTGSILKAGVSTFGTIAASDAAQLVADGKPTDLALEVGALRGGVMGVGVTMPFSMPLLRGSGALSATAQRLGYAAGLNGVLGAVGRGGESTILENHGYTQEAAQLHWNDSRAMATDVILGLAFGGLARWKDYHPPKARETAQAETVQLEQDNAPVFDLDGANAQIETAIQTKFAQQAEVQAKKPFNRAEYEKVTKRIDELENELSLKFAEELPVNKSRVLEYRQLLQRENPKLKAREAIRQAEALEQAERTQQIEQVGMDRARLKSEIGLLTEQKNAYENAKLAEGKASEIRQKLSEARTAEDRLNAINEPMDSPLRSLVESMNKQDAKAVLEARERLTTDVVDAALLSNLQLARADMAAGKPKNMDDHLAALDEAEQALLQERPVNVETIRRGADVTEDPRVAKQIEDNLRAWDEELTQEDKSLIIPDDGAPMPPRVENDLTPRNIPDDDAHAAEQADLLMQTMRDDTIMLDPLTGKKTTWGEMKKEFNLERAKAQDIGDTITNLASCMLKGGA